MLLFSSIRITHYREHNELQQRHSSRRPVHYNGVVDYPRL